MKYYYVGDLFQNEGGDGIWCWLGSRWRNRENQIDLELIVVEESLKYSILHKFFHNTKCPFLKRQIQNVFKGK